MDKNTQQPVAWRVFRSTTEYELFISEYNATQRAKQLGFTAVQPLYHATHMPRDVLMEFGEAVRDAIHEYNGVDISHAVDLAAIADRYASQAQPEQVNQQLLAALKACDEAMSYISEYDIQITLPDMMRSAIDAAELSGNSGQLPASEAAQPVGQQYLLGGRRFKVTHSQDHGFAITGLPQTMNGQWVAFVDATDNCHMQQQQPASAQPVVVPDERIYKLLRDLVFFLENSTKFSSRNYSDRRNQLHEDAQLLLYAAQKQDGV